MPAMPEKMSLPNDEIRDQTSFLLPEYDERTSTPSIQIHQPYDTTLLSPNVFNSTPLSPLIQRSPTSARTPYSNDGKFSTDHKVYDGFNSHDYNQDLENHYNPNHKKKNKVLKFFQYDKEKWTDPGEALGHKTVMIAILTACGLMGLFVLLGKASNGFDELETHSNSNSIHPHANISRQFPFSPSHYLEDCKLQATDLSLTEDGMENHITLNNSLPIHIPYFSLTKEEKEFEDLQPYSKTDNQGRTICSKTLTYLLDDDFGMAFHLNAITLAFALAKKDGRTFFIADGEWDRGLWNDHFQELPAPDCQPPPPEEMMGCPRSSRHWIITSSIFPYHFSDSEFLLAYGDDKVRNEKKTDGLPSLIPKPRKPIFEMAKDSFESIFSLNHENLKLIEETKQEIIDSNVWKGGENGKLAPFVSVHIRKGDRHPFNQDHKLDYIPITNYLDAINSTWTQLRSTNEKLPLSPNVFVASDTPLIMDVLNDMVPTWNLFHLSQSFPKQLSLIAHPHEYSQRHFHAHVKSERIGYTRGQIIDMNFLAGGWSSKIHQTDETDKPLATICTVSSNICQFAALQLGWKTSFEDRKWINLDLPLTHSWTGIEIPKPGSGDEADVHVGGAHHHR
ncbi:uncharacterized protein MELLADRAFT_86650 [Melampsora larici-populina 98AG31]|uniref:Uncharacterized protein n=1 Tax=Melampsora larici-populina (strain 98AG31 / pathotype 3-4-7) TaxID=747676 RepID=F4RMJ0_MELLP|nr:uncharacterized protein MELLADRAFT_86650 [Melampsora larici-populina 98AG31]EGG06462.1 hypothetical protein MELLADRAFT_86650 [Melampsora larici-populina 98AG31]